MTKNEWRDIGKSRRQALSAAEVTDRDEYACIYQGAYSVITRRVCAQSLEQHYLFAVQILQIFFHLCVRCALVNPVACYNNSEVIRGRSSINLRQHTALACSLSQSLGNPFRITGFAVIND